MIPAQGSNGGGAVYGVIDPVGKQGDHYWLQEVESDGEVKLYGPVQAKALASTLRERNLFLPMIGR